MLARRLKNQSMNRPFARLPRSLRPPIRDILRGVSTAAEVTEELLKPAAPLIPEPVRSLFAATLKAVETAGQAELHQPLDRDDIERAVGFIDGSGTDKTYSRAFRRVLIGAWARSRAMNSPSPVHLSATVAAMVINSIDDASAGSGSHRRAAEVLAQLRKRHAVGNVPGTPISRSVEDQNQADLDLVGIFVWLLAERAHSADEEERLLQLATTLVHTLQGEVLQRLDDAAALADELQRLADYL